VVARGSAYTVPCTCTTAPVQYVAHFVALHNGPTTGASKPACWPALYSGSTGAAMVPNAAGKRQPSYTTHAVLVPVGGGTARWGAVHVYPGKGANTAASAANGTAVAMAAPAGATVGGAPCRATLALAAALGLAAPGAS